MEAVTYEQAIKEIVTWWLECKNANVEIAKAKKELNAKCKAFADIHNVPAEWVRSKVRIRAGRISDGLNATGNTAN